MTCKTPERVAHLEAGLEKALGVLDRVHATVAGIVETLAESAKVQARTIDRVQTHEDHISDLQGIIDGQAERIQGLEAALVLLINAIEADETEALKTDEGDEQALMALTLVEHMREALASVGVPGIEVDEGINYDA